MRPSAISVCYLFIITNKAKASRGGGKRCRYPERRRTKAYIVARFRQIYYFNDMVTTFKDKNEDSDFSLRFVLSETQIKSWVSSEAGCRKTAAVNRVIDIGFAELSQSIDMQDNIEEMGHDQNKGGPEEGEEEFLLLSLLLLLLLLLHFRTWFPDIFTVSGFLKFLD